MSGLTLQVEGLARDYLVGINQAVNVVILEGLLKKGVVRYFFKKSC